MEIDIKDLPLSDSIGICVIVPKSDLSLVGIGVVKDFIQQVIERNSCTEALRMLSVLMIDIYRAQLLKDAINQGEDHAEV
jgi:hypothetical protein